MNWERTKSIFIFVFLVLNVFLGVQLWEKQNKQLELTQVYDSSIDELLIVKNIVVQPEISSEQPALGQLHVEIETLETEFTRMNQGQMQAEVVDDILKVQVHSAYTLPETFDEQLFKEEWMSEHVAFANEYELDDQRGDKLHYFQMYDGFPLFVGRLVFPMDEERELSTYEQLHFHVLNQGTQQTVLSAFNVLRALLENQEIPDRSVITHFNLGYRGQIYEVDSQVLTPTWRIILEEQHQWRTIYVNALTGNIETVVYEEWGE